MARSKEMLPRLRWLGLPPRVALGFVAALVSLAAAAGASYAALMARDAASLLVRHTDAAQHVIAEIESALLVSHFAPAAHAALEDPRDRDLLLRATSKMQPALADLQRISEQHPEQKPLIARLAADVDVVSSQQAKMLALIEAGDLSAARAIAALRIGREALERAITAMERIEREETSAHLGREAAWRRNVLVSNAIFVAAVCVLLVLIFVAARLVRDDIRLREADRAERERALVVQRRLMAVVSHDLRNPLGAILAAGGTLARLDLPPRALPMARRIVSAGRRMEGLIRDLLDWNRMQRGGPIPIAIREADLYEVCQRMADELRNREGNQVLVEREGDTRAIFDPERMEQVVGNLLANALRCATPGTPVLVRAVGTPHEVRVEVHDQGPGIPPEARGKIFEPFQQGPSGHEAGVGLGLFVVRAVAEAHGGSVELASEPGKTSFVVRLPRPDGPNPGDGGRCG